MVISESQLLFDIEKNSFWIIPELITHLIIAFYAEIECFKHMKINSFNITDNGRTITRIDDDTSDDFRTVWIKNNSI